MKSPRCPQPKQKSANVIRLKAAAYEALLKDQHNLVDVQLPPLTFIRQLHR